ncbi:hypothetical protein DPMN_130187 [Dreissena polymorpha]|uniref:Uncharacterized protein n=1 Tax=Dreissena polymorpha TaxID=45954 RepID=A0A9D4H2J6_DREPO|nr:hypothetical protein DPMN_130187 [Dreissena polymorpha]
MIFEQKKGNYASIRFDKLYINNDIYKFYDNSQSVERIASRRSFQPRAHRPRGYNNNRSDERRFADHQGEIPRGPSVTDDNLSPLVTDDLFAYRSDISEDDDTPSQSIIA